MPRLVPSLVPSLVIDTPGIAPHALGLLVGLDPDLVRTIGLSLGVSVSATALAAVIGLPLGAALAACRFTGRRTTIVAANALLGLPPVVVGLALYLLLSRSGPLGRLDLLFTPSAMAVAQFLLAVPIVTALAHRGMDAIWTEFGPAFQIDGASAVRAIPHMLAIGQDQATTAVLAGFGRSLSEVGAILIVGGNIAGYTRTMTTSIALQTSEGHLASALALGIVLIAISTLVSLCAFLLRQSHDIPRVRREDPHGGDIPA